MPARGRGCPAAGLQRPTFGDAVLPRRSGSASGHRDDDLASYVSLLDAAKAVGGLGERVGPVEDRRELPGLDEPGEGEQSVAVLFVRKYLKPLPDQTVDHHRSKNGAHRPEHVAG